VPSGPGPCSTSRAVAANLASEASVSCRHQREPPPPRTQTSRLYRRGKVYVIVRGWDCQVRTCRTGACGAWVLGFRFRLRFRSSTTKRDLPLASNPAIPASQTLREPTDPLIPLWHRRVAASMRRIRCRQPARPGNRVASPRQRCRQSWTVGPPPPRSRSTEQRTVEPRTRSPVRRTDRNQEPEREETHGGSRSVGLRFKTRTVKARRTDPRIARRSDIEQGTPPVAD
jgi:hypothetical protein